MRQDSGWPLGTSQLKNSALSSKGLLLQEANEACSKFLTLATGTGLEIARYLAAATPRNKENRFGIYKV